MESSFCVFIACALVAGCLTLSLDDLHSQGLQKSSLQKRLKDPRAKSSESASASASKKVLELIRQMENHLKSDDGINHQRFQSSKKIKRKQSTVFSGRHLVQDPHPSIRKRSVHPPNDLMEGQYAYFVHQPLSDSELQHDPQMSIHLKKRSPSRIVTDMRNKKMLGKKRKGRSYDDQSVMGELKNILKEDEEEKRIKKRRETTEKQEIGPLNKTFAAKDLHEKQKRQSEGDVEEVNPKKLNQKAFNEWLQREYYKNMAKSFATMRKKRAEWGPLVAQKKSSQLPNEEEEEEDKKRKRDASNISTHKTPEQFEDVIGKLKKIENALLTDALRMMEYGSGEINHKQEIVDDLSAAYDLEIMTMAMDHLKTTLKKITAEERKENLIEKRKDSSELYRAGTPDEPTQYPWYPISKVSDDEEKASTSEHPEDFNDDDDKKEAMLSHLLNLYDDYLRTEDEEEAGEQCPPLNLLTSDCSALTDIVKDGPLQQLLRHSCNWHEVCYSCGEAFGLTSKDCDAGFLRESHTICLDDLPCQTSARLLLLPLRQRRVFYKRSNPTVCYVDPCVEEFLRKG